jgi:hypothetical protein
MRFADSSGGSVKLLGAEGPCSDACSKRALLGGRAFQTVITAEC